jgi:alanyl-tRNA synthetase
MGFERAQCKCGANFWHYSTVTPNTCGDSQCDQKYGFIGHVRGIGKKSNQKFTPKDAWDSFSRALTSTDPACTPIKRYPVVARWRDDVDFVQAGIYCFQPYCVTGELQPPANPLICPQFCVRFNDLDNIGITGRHYSGFVMLGIQAFNNKNLPMPDGKEFWMDECLLANYKWLTQELCIPAEEITFIEDVWAGGGNLGPSIEYFVQGLEVGNMVFMQFKTFPDGRREELDVRVIDVGIGLERIPWLINGSSTSYLDVFPIAYKYLSELTGVEPNTEVWSKFGPLSCLLNVDEVDDLSKTWQWIADQIGMDVPTVRRAIEPVRDLYIVLDHTRTLLMTIQDGSLPQNTGGGSNIRNVIRRAFAILKKNGWFEKIGGIDGLLMVCEKHKEDLSQLYGQFSPYSSFGDILRREYQLYNTHDIEQRKKLDNILKKKLGKEVDGKKLTLEDWIVCITGHGISADLIEQISGEPVPLNLWYEIDYRQQQTMKLAAPQLYSLATVDATVSLYEDEFDHRKLTFQDSKVVEVLPIMTDPEMPLGMVILDKSPFYPTSGGQDHDTGALIIDGKEHKVVDCIRVGPCVLHQIEPPFKTRDQVMGKTVDGYVDASRRDQLRIHHTATHIIYATCRKVLGPHVWQNGARKKVSEAHLDITHYSALTFEQMMQIEQEANKVIRAGKAITKNTQQKDVAEQRYGFHLYQGGVVPGNSLRIVNIADTDTEACCGTHCDNTSEVGLIKLLSARRVTDGVVRLTYVAGDRALEELAKQSTVIDTLANNLSVQHEHVVDTATSFFKQALVLQKRVASQGEQILEYQLKLITADPHNKLFLCPTDENTPTLYITKLQPYYKQLKEQGKVVVFLGATFIYGFVGDLTKFNLETTLKQWLNDNHQSDQIKASTTLVKNEQGQYIAVPVENAEEIRATFKAPQLVVKNKVQGTVAAEGTKKASKVDVSDVALFQCFTLYGHAKLVNQFGASGFVTL